MPFKRYEGLLPTRYNDGTPVPDRKFHQTWMEILLRFGGLTADLYPRRGLWTHEGVTYEDQVIEFKVDVEDTPENRAWFVRWKSKLKRRFRQEEIWMVSIPIEVL